MAQQRGEFAMGVALVVVAGGPRPAGGADPAADMVGGDRLDPRACPVLAVVEMVPGEVPNLDECRARHGPGVGRAGKHPDDIVPDPHDQKRVQGAERRAVTGRDPGDQDVQSIVADSVDGLRGRRQ